MPDEAPELSVLIRLDRFPSGDFEVVEVPRQVIAVRASLDPDVEHACRATVEALLDRADPSRPHHLHEAGFREHLDVVGDGALRPLDRRRQLGHRRRPLVEQVQDRGAERMADRLHLRRGGESDPVGELVVRGRVADHGLID